VGPASAVGNCPVEVIAIFGLLTEKAVQKMIKVHATMVAKSKKYNPRKIDLAEELEQKSVNKYSLAMAYANEAYGAGYVERSMPDIHAMGREAMGVMISSNSQIAVADLDWESTQTKIDLSKIADPIHTAYAKRMEMIGARSYGVPVAAPQPGPSVPT
jgi:hypothetical protein